MESLTFTLADKDIEFTVSSRAFSSAATTPGQRDTTPAPFFHSNTLEYQHYDRDIIFTVSSAAFSEERLLQGGNTPDHGHATITVPLPTSADKGKHLVVDASGMPVWAPLLHTTIPQVKFRHQAITTGVTGDVATALNADPKGLSVGEGELWSIQDKGKNKVFFWVGTTGLFGTTAGGVKVTPDMLQEVVFTQGDSVVFATPQEAEAGTKTHVALDPANARYLDIDGGQF